jgi:hypothetical protein
MGNINMKSSRTIASLRSALTGLPEDKKIAHEERLNSLEKTFVELQQAIASGDRHQVASLMQQQEGGLLVDEEMIKEAIETQPPSMTLLLIAGQQQQNKSEFERTESPFQNTVSTLYNLGIKGDYKWLDTLIEKGMSLNSAYGSGNTLWQMVIDNSSEAGIAFAQHLMDLKSKVNNQTLHNCPIQSVISSNNLKYFLKMGLIQIFLLRIPRLHF